MVCQYLHKFSEDFEEKFEDKVICDELCLLGTSVLEEERFVKTP